MSHPDCPDPTCNAPSEKRWALLDDRGTPPALVVACCTAAALEAWLRDRRGCSVRRVTEGPHARETTSRLVTYEWTERRDAGLSCVRDVPRAAVVCSAGGLIAPGGAAGGGEGASEVNA